MRLLLSVFAIAALAACSSSESSATAKEVTTSDVDITLPSDAKTLVVAGGCFWCVESDFEKLEGVYEAVSGYSGGDNRDATYRNHEGHREVATIYYDPKTVSYAELLDFFLRSIDPTDDGGQFCDRGYAYTTAIYPKSEEERDAAEAAISKAEQELGQDIVTAVEAFKFAVTAEDYHQDYYKKNPVRYRFYRNGCGRDRRVTELWGKPAH